MRPVVQQYNVYKKGDAFTRTSVESVLLIGDYPEDIHFSIFILTYKRLDLLKQAVFSALNQKPCSLNYRVIVLDNSGYGSEEQIKNETFLRTIDNRNLVYYANKENIGVGNWNRIFELSKSKYLSMLHDDDILYDDYLFLVDKLLKNGAMKNTAMILPSKDYRVIKTAEESRVYNNLRPRLSQKVKIVNISESLMLLRGYSLQNSPSPGCIFDRDIMLENGGYPYDAGPKIDDIPAWALVKRFRIKLIANYPCGEYRLFQNNSLNIDTMKSIVAKSCEIHACVYKKSLFWKVYYAVFSKTLFTIQVNVQLNTAKKCLVRINENDFIPFKYKKRRIKVFLLNFLSRVKRFFAKREYIDLKI